MKANDILHSAASTYEERNAAYGDNYRRVGPALTALFGGNPVVLEGAADHELFHLLSLIVVKLSRFTTSGCTHRDSIHDAAVYAAMIESILVERQQAAQQKEVQ